MGNRLAPGEGLRRAAGQAARTAPRAAEGMAAPALQGMELFAACRALCCPSSVQQPCRETRTTDIAQSSKFRLRSDARSEGLGTRQARGRAARGHGDTRTNTSLLLPEREARGDGHDGTGMELY